MGIGICYAISAGGSCFGWPSDEDEEGFNFGKELAEHLDPRDVALLFEAGAEGLRYVTGTAVAINPSGDIVVLDLLDIFDRAKAAFGDGLTIGPTGVPYRVGRGW